MKPVKLSSLLAAAIVLLTMTFTQLASAQIIAYDEAGNYVVTANWTNGANQGTGFTPWVITTNGPDFVGTYLTSLNNPTFTIASLTNLTGTNYSDVWGTFANGTNGINQTVAYRGFASPLGTNTFKLQWGSRGAGVTTVTGGGGQVHGWCGFTLRNGNATNSVIDFQTSPMFYLYFLDGAVPPTLYVWDGSNGGFPFSVPGTSFSDLGRGNITNAIEAEITPSADGISYHLVLKDTVVGRTIYTLDSVFISSGTVDSVALFNKETTGDQIYNRMQITSPTNVAPTIVNVQPANGSIFLDANSTTVSFEVDSFNSTLASNLTTVTLNGASPALTYNIATATNKLVGTVSTTLAPNTFYTLKIVAQDANGNITTNTSTFNTFLATDLYIDCGDYNYTSGGVSGQFVNSSTPANSYSAFFGSNGVDYLESDLTGTNNAYRAGDLPQVLSLNTDATGDPVAHAGGGFTIFSLGFTDIGEWQNYTRVLPSNTNYSIYARSSSVSGGQFEVDLLAASTATASNQPLAALGSVNVAATGGSKVCTGQLSPLTDIFGNTVIVPLSGTKTIRTTATQSRTYNLEYLVVVPITNAVGTLRPYISVANPGPNATAIPVSTKLTFTVANRQTTVTNVTLAVNNTNATGLVLSSNAAGTTVTFTPTTNYLASATNTYTVVFTDSTGTKTTNSWSFFTTPGGGLPGNGVWSAGGGADLSWSTAANWTGGTPGPSNTATFASVGSTTTLVTNNIVTTNTSVAQLFYNTNNNGFNTTLIQDGVTLTVFTNGTAITGLMQVGGTSGGDNVFNKKVTNTITGLNGTLVVAGNSQASGLLNQLNFQVRQAASPAAADQVVLDMSGLGTFSATVGKFYVAQGGANTSLGQTNVSGRVDLARTNTITCLRSSAGHFEVGDSSGGTFTLAGSTLNFGITNALFVDTMRLGKAKATNNLIRFNPLFTGFNPTVFIRGTNGLSSRLTTLTIGDADTETTVPNFVQANVDLSAGKLDALVGSLILARGEATATDTGFAQGTLSYAAGTLDATNVQVGVQRGVNTSVHTGIINLTGTATLSSTNINLALTNAGANASLVTGTLNVTNGTVRGNINAGGGTSTVNLNGGTLIVSNNVGSAAVPISALNLTGASLHLKVDGNNTTTANIYATAVTASGTSVITIDSVTNVTGPKTVHLISYTGSSPFGGLSLAALPGGYTGSLVNNSGSVDLNVNVSVTPPPPTIRTIVFNGANQVVISGTNNQGSGGTYSLLTSTNVALALTNWTVLSSGSFDGSGNFSLTNTAGTNTQRFFILKVP